jgi:hypothetical protein
MKSQEPKEEAIYEYMYIYKYTYMCKYVYVCTYKNIHINVYINIYIYIGRLKWSLRNLKKRQSMRTHKDILTLTP